MLRQYVINSSNIRIFIILSRYAADLSLKLCLFLPLRLSLADWFGPPINEYVREPCQNKLKIIKEYASFMIIYPPSNTLPQHVQRLKNTLLLVVFPDRGGG